jgi:hypothetical protein
MGTGRGFARSWADYEATGNILPESNAAPALQAHQRELERHMRRDSLEKHLQRRPTAEELVKEGILEGKRIMTRCVASY